MPVEVYFKKGGAKIQLAVAKGKHLIDKREALKKRDLNREMEKGFKNKIRILGSFYSIKTALRQGHLGPLKI